MSGKNKDISFDAKSVTTKKNAYEKLKDVRNKKDLFDYIDWLYQDSNSPVVQVIYCHRNTFNQIYAIANENDLLKFTCGLVVLGIEHNLGILILVNDSYGR